MSADPVGLAAHYPEHVALRQQRAEEHLGALGYDGLVISSGKPFRYFADDQDAPFRRTPHFAHWVPLHGPHHLLYVRPGQKPMLVRVAPEDYWYEQVPIDAGGDPFWVSEFELIEVPDVEAAWRVVSKKGTVGYVGDDPKSARARKVKADDINPEALLARLDWDRSYKTPYEVGCLAEAGRLGGKAHQAAKRAFEGGASELEIHRAFVEALGVLDHQLPYNSIVALDEKGAVLHYEGKRPGKPGRDAAIPGNVLLIDAGANYNGYGSDITRTWTRAGADPEFVDLVAGLDELQRGLCDQVKPGLPYGDLHHAAHVAIANLLFDAKLITVSGEEAVERGLSSPFYPHGLGHFLGIQTHDVAGHQAGPQGGRVPPPERYPFLRTTRTIEAGQVFTVEPGLYFIEMLLREHRSGDARDAFNWERIDRLAPHGGIRIEDNVVVTAEGHRNLTRAHV